MKHLFIVTAIMAMFLATMAIQTTLTLADTQQGEVGPQGPAGPAGADGINGTNGIDGVNGVDGKDGLNFDNAELQRGLATVAALTIPHIDVGKKFGVSASTGFYGSHPAIGLGIGLRLNDNWQVGGSVATDTDGRNVAGKGTVSAQW